jgi:hypothetical protein
VWRVVVAIGADIPRPTLPSFVRHSLIGLPHPRARLPDGIEHWHLISLRWQSTFADIAISRRFAENAAASALLTPRPQATQLRGVMSWGCVMEQEFYQGLGHRIRALGEKADPFTRRRLLDLAKRYDAKGGTARSAATERPLPVPRTTPAASVFSGPGET